MSHKATPILMKKSDLEEIKTKFLRLNLIQTFFGKRFFDWVGTINCPDNVGTSKSIFTI